MRLAPLRLAPLCLLAVACVRPVPLRSTAPTRPPPAEHPSTQPRAAAEADPKRDPAPVVLHVGTLLDGLHPPQQKVSLLVQDQKIVAIKPEGTLTVPPGAREIDLRDATVLPGLIDGHTHIMSDGADRYLDQLIDKSIPYRALEASAAARRSLGNGFTALRDVESEGAMFADADLKNAINRGLIPGPRLWVSTRGLSTTGRYHPFGTSWELALPTGAQLVVGELAARAAVREQIAHGADWIKVYVDFGPLDIDDRGTIQAPRNFTDAELGAIIEEAHRFRRRVAAHATGRDGILQALTLGVDSIEHAWGLDEDLARQALRRGVFICPTTQAEIPILTAGPELFKRLLPQAWKNLARAHKLGLKLAYCTDAGSFPWTENQAAGLPLYVEKLGMTPAEVLRAATLVGAELVGQKGTLGQLTPGALADLIAVRGDPLTDLHVLEHVFFVMQGGHVFRHDR